MIENKYLILITVIIIGLIILNNIIISIGRKNIENFKKIKILKLTKDLEEILKSNKENFNIGVEAGPNSEEIYNKIEEDIIRAIRKTPLIISESEIFEIEQLRDWKRLQEKLLEITTRLKKEV